MMFRVRRLNSKSITQADYTGRWFSPFIYSTKNFYIAQNH